MTVVLVTGMSGTGKSAALTELSRRGYRVVDTDYGGWTEGEPGSERLWREDRIAGLLDEDEEGVLFISGCAHNQGRCALPGASRTTSAGPAASAS